MTITYRISPPVGNDDLNALYAAAWPKHRDFDFTFTLSYNLLYVCGYDGERLVAFVYVAWDGSIHGFLLEPTVHPDVQRRGIGTELVRHAAEAAKERGVYWLHVDYEPHLDGFYRACGFEHTLAGLMRLE